MRTVKFNSSYKSEMIDITEQVKDEVVKLGVRDGLCTVFCSHTTASVVFFENQDPKLRREFLANLSNLMPRNENSKDDNSDAHFKSTLCGQRVVLPVVNGQLFLGKWQGIFFCEFDGPRDREFHIQVI